jgi:ABC-type multidrug transport system fused ATPase/permease subunit
MSTPRRVWALLDLRERRRALRLQFVALVMAVSTLGGVAALVPFLMVLADPRLIATNRVLSAAYTALGFTGTRSFLVALGGAFIGSVLLTNAINLAGSLAMTRFSLAVGDRLHTSLFAEYLRRDYLFHVRKGSVALGSNVLYAVNRIVSGVIEAALLLVTNSLVVVCIFASIVYVDPVIAAISAAWVGVAYLVFYLLFRRRLLRAGEVEGQRMTERARITTEGLQAIKEIQTQCAQGYFVAEFARACGTISRGAMNLQAITLAPKHVLEVVTVICLVVSALVVSAERSLSAWLAELAFLGFAAYRLLPAIQQVFAALIRLRSSQAIFDSVADDLRSALQAPGARPAPDARSWQARPRQSIRLEHVHFRYGDARGSVLEDLSIEIRAGTMACIIGPNGSGKTTLLDLIAGLLTPQSGRVSIDGEALDRDNVGAWHSRIAYVPQQVFLLDNTIAANIALGVAAAQIDPQRLRTALRLARLEDLVASLPRGVDERVGERGVALSGGQRQRIAVARALYREPAVLLLDEPTSALDGFVEREFVDMLAGLRGRCTLVLVAHSVNTIRHCDQLFELEGGRLVRAGTWSELAQAPRLPAVPAVAP